MRRWAGALHLPVGLFEPPCQQRVVEQLDGHAHAADRPVEPTLLGEGTLLGYQGERRLGGRRGCFAFRHRQERPGSLFLLNFTSKPSKRTSAACLFLTSLTQSARAGELIEPVFTLIARLLVDVLGVARHRRHGDLLRVVDDISPGPVRVGARRFLGEHVEELLGGRRNATQRFYVPREERSRTS